MDTKRRFDFMFALLAVVCLLPALLLIAAILKLYSRGHVFYRQIRVGRNLKCFMLIKFRTMCAGADARGLLTVGRNDTRITMFGGWLRKFKLDELPQLFNILKGEMSFVGPRPEVSRYVNFYNDQQRRVLTVKPGITDWASIRYFRESEMLALAEDPEDFYINTVLPSKITQNLEYVDHHDLWTDCKIIAYTIKRILIK